MTPIRVLICDDQDMIRQGLKTILDRQSDISVVGLAADGLQAAQMARELKPDVALMDIKMPNLDGIGATRRITQENAAIHVIILTTYDTDDMVFDGIRAGAQGYLLKDAGSEAILSAIRGAAKGESQLDPQIARKVMDAFRRASPAHPATLEATAGPEIEALTERETEILQLIAEGLNNKDIAARLFLSEGTVRNYGSSILSKLHANDRTQAVVLAAKRGIVKL
jgi:DNA-binding NarL/FixJ family response regulator